MDVKTVARNIIAAKGIITKHNLVGELNAIEQGSATGSSIMAAGITNPGEYPNWSFAGKRFFYTETAPDPDEV